MAQCVYCGCIDAQACDGGCEWVVLVLGLGICSACGKKAKRAGSERRIAGRIDRALVDLMSGQPKKQVLIEARDLLALAYDAAEEPEVD